MREQWGWVGPPGGQVVQKQLIGGAAAGGTRNGRDSSFANFRSCRLQFCTSSADGFSLKLGICFPTVVGKQMARSLS